MFAVPPILIADNYLSPSPSDPHITLPGSASLPSLILDSGEEAWLRYIEFFTAHIRNPNTRAAYAHAVDGFFRWCSKQGIADLREISPFAVAGYIEQLSASYSAPTVKQALAAIRMLCDFLVVGQILPVNPAASVRGPRHVVAKGKTPVLGAAEASDLLASIETTEIGGARDRALIAVMVFSFARVGAVVALNVEDYIHQDGRRWLRLAEKGGKRHAVPVHLRAEQFLDEYLAAAAIANQRGTPLFRTLDRKKRLTDRRLHRREVLAMVKRRAAAAGLPPEVCCHTFRATGITAYLKNGGTIEHAQQIAAHESPRTTKLYDRTSDSVSIEEIDRLRI